MSSVMRAPTVELEHESPALVRPSGRWYKSAVVVGVGTVFSNRWEIDAPLARGSTSNFEMTPAPTVALPAKIDHLEAGCTMTCAQSDARMFCWGRNDWLQLGIPTVGDSAVPVEAWRGPRGSY